MSSALFGNVTRRRALIVNWRHVNIAEKGRSNHHHGGSLKARVMEENLIVIVNLCKLCFLIVIVFWCC
jgi:hypothetical protein